MTRLQKIKILKRRAAGDRLKVIAADFNVSMSYVSKLSKGKLDVN